MFHRAGLGRAGPGSAGLGRAWADSSGKHLRVFTGEISHQTTDNTRYNIMIELPPNIIGRLVMNCGAVNALEGEGINSATRLGPAALVTAEKVSMQCSVANVDIDIPDLASPQWLLFDMDPETGRTSVLASLGYNCVELGAMHINEITELGQEVITDLPDFNLLTYWRAAQDMPDKRITLDPDKLRAAAQALAREALEAADD